MTFYALLLVAAVAAVAFALGRRRVLAQAQAGAERMHSLPGTYGWYALLWTIVPGSLLVLSLLFGLRPALLEEAALRDLPAALQPADAAARDLLLNDIRTQRVSAAEPALRAAAERHAALQRRLDFAGLGLWLAFAATGCAFALRRIAPAFDARPRVERALRIALGLASTCAILVTLGIVLALLTESLAFFRRVPVSEFLFGTRWSPQIALREDQVGSSGAFGALPVLWGTALITAIAMFVALPIGLLAAIYMAFYAAPGVRAIAKPALELLAGIPTVVYGFFAALTVAPALRGVGAALGLDVASESALAAGVVMGVMIIPFVSSLSDDALRAVPQAMIDGSFGLGATSSETIRNVVLPAALPGIVGAFLLAISRAIGETMIVVMAAGLSARLTLNPLEAVTTVTVQIVTLLTGDQEFDSAKTLAAFALGLLLFVLTLVLNLIALRFVQRYREQYE